MKYDELLNLKKKLNKVFRQKMKQESSSESNSKASEMIWVYLFIGKDESRQNI